MIWKLFWMFTKLGFVSIGGGYPMMALILQEGEAMVGLTAAEFADMAALELLASGPIAINAATYVGFIKAGVAGSIAATAGVCVSPFILTSILYYFLKKYQHNRYVQGFLSAIKVATGGILVTTCGTLGREILMHTTDAAQIAAAPLQAVSWIGVAVCAACFIAGLKWKTNPIFLVLASALAGALLL